MASHLNATAVTSKNLSTRCSIPLVNKLRSKTPNTHTKLGSWHYHLITKMYQLYRSRQLQIKEEKIAAERCDLNTIFNHFKEDARNIRSSHVVFLHFMQAKHHISRKHWLGINLLKLSLSFSIIDIWEIKFAKSMSTGIIISLSILHPEIIQL